MSRNRGKTLSATLNPDDATELLAAFAELPYQLKKSVRDASELIATTEASRLQTAARADSKQTALVAPSITMTRGDTPSIVAGGTGKVAGHNATYGDILFGAEFGGQKTRFTMQFRPHQGKEGYWLFPTLRDDMDDIVDAYRVALEQAQEAAGFGGEN